MDGGSNGHKHREPRITPRSDMRQENPLLTSRPLTSSATAVETLRRSSITQKYHSTLTINIYVSGLVIGRRTWYAVRGRQAIRLKHSSVQHQAGTALIQSSTDSLLFKLLFPDLVYMCGSNTKKEARSLFLHSFYPFQKLSHTSCSFHAVQRTLTLRLPLCFRTKCINHKHIRCIPYKYQSIFKNRTQVLCHYCMAKYHGLTKFRAAISCHQLQQLKRK